MTAIPTQIGPYEIAREIGRGGMGVVYLARDTKLDRDVAIKCLPPEVTDDKERLARFEREAKLLASLNHPHIATIFGLEEADGNQYLILEFIEGETLAERIGRGAIAVTETLLIAKQIAEAIEAAHEKGIIHRDLKPANIKFTAEGEVKVLDFGLAKAIEDHSRTGSEIANSPTLVEHSPTMPGVVLGTAGYLSPEQARGRPVDKRTDIFAFGCILYEMLAGTSLFAGESISDSIGAALHKNPDWDILPRDLPPTIHLMLRRCLVKDRTHRLQDIGDARVAIEEVISGEVILPGLNGAVSAEAPSSQRRMRLLGSLVALFALTTVVSAWLAFRPRTVPALPSVNLSIIHRAGEPLNTNVFVVGSIVAMSPDGSRMAYIGSRDGTSHVFVRHLSSYDSRMIPGTEGATAPFFSPDGGFVGFVADAKLRVIAIDGSISRVLCDAPNIRGACWMEPDTILFSASTTTALEFVSVSDGTITPLTRFDAETGEVTHRFPEMLPDGRHALFTLRGENVRSGDESLAVVDLRTGEHEIILDHAGHARYVDGVIVFGKQDGSVSAIRFDPTTLAVSGSPVTVLAGVRVQQPLGSSNFSVAGNGTLAYVPGAAWWKLTSPLWRTRDGESVIAIPELQRFTVGRLSPDDRYFAVVCGDPEPDIWKYDLSIDPPTRLRLTSDGVSVLPVWSPDGQWIVFASGRSGNFQMYKMHADGSDEPTLIQASPHYQWATSWSSDGTLLAYMEEHPETGDDVWILPLDGDRQPWPVAAGPSQERHPTFSPDDEWVAYASTESGESEIYVRRTSGTGGTYPISVGGGANPLWHDDEIFYRRGDELMAVTVATEPEFSRGPPRSLFGGLSTTGPPVRIFDISEDGERFITTGPERESDESTFMEFRVVTNWIEQVKRKLPAPERAAN